MNVLVTADHNFIKPLSTLILSISKNNQSEKINYFLPYIKSKSLSDKDKNLLKKYLKEDDTISFIELGEECMLQTPSSKPRWNYQLWLKFFSIFYLSDNMDRILYIDSDCLIVDNISAFYKTPFQDNKFIIGINEEFRNGNDNKVSLERIKIHSGFDYINVGIMLINVVRFKMAMKNPSYIINEYNGLPFTPQFYEQDYINYLHRQEIQYVTDRKYMFLAKWYVKEENEKIIVYHYAGSPKPWQYYESIYDKSIYKLYWKYAKKTFGMLKYLGAEFLSFRKKIHKTINKIIKIR